MRDVRLFYARIQSRVLDLFKSISDHHNYMEIVSHLISKSKYNVQYSILSYQWTQICVVVFNACNRLKKIIFIP